MIIIKYFVVEVTCMSRTGCYQVTCKRNGYVEYNYVIAHNIKEVEEIIKLEFGNSVVIEGIYYEGVGILR